MSNSVHDIDGGWRKGEQLDCAGKHRGHLCSVHYACVQSLLCSVHYADAYKETSRLAENLRYSIILAADNPRRLIATVAAVGCDCTDASVYSRLMTRPMTANVALRKFSLLELLRK